ncbi:MAG: hypothetical protein HN704_07380 [Bacteroidetes bacterium]|jgi:hypothetical protein|nr:hypothetical protein [Bacteroidota bacterium]MBT6687628.1 hypothetical protein [Bacteroidota bacterium]MBT7144783.1 hypothetical protein [Bacteroidota bacterium]MBT7491410.1 hypothetical protein [Bacteroidota bacterium]
MESKTRYLLGSIIAVSAIGIIILKFITNGDIDSYVMPFILLCLSVIVFLPKTKKVKPQKEISKKFQKVILSIVSLALVTGIITFFATLF